MKSYEWIIPPDPDVARDMNRPEWVVKSMEMLLPGPFTFERVIETMLACNPETEKFRARGVSEETLREGGIKAADLFLYTMIETGCLKEITVQ